MKKILLNVDVLAVESFPTQAGGVEPLGTVDAAMASPRGTCIANSCYTSCAGAGRDAPCTCPV